MTSTAPEEPATQLDTVRRMEDSAMKDRALRLGLIMVLALLGLTGCGVFADQVTDCDTSTKPVACQPDERFDLAGTSILVDELETITEAGDNGQDEARVEAAITLEGKPSRALRAQLHIADPLAEEDLVIEPDRALVQAGERTFSWDFSGHGFAHRIQFDRFTPHVFLIFSDGENEVVVDVIRVESTEDAP
ncbi:hypothetical protein [Leucobacter sp. GX24907]